MPRTNFLGLNMDATMVPKVVAACRGLYPNLVSSTDSDNRVIQLVLRQIITEHLAAWAARTVADPAGAAEQARSQAEDQQKAADHQARVDATDILPTATT
jgi:hypothetical protein